MILSNQYVKQVLINSGWYEKRAVDTSPYIEWYKKYGFEISDNVIKFLSSFGGLTLQIPCYRYKVRNNPDESCLDIIINPNYYITYDFSSYDIKDSIEYSKEIASFLGIEKLFPIGHSTNDEDDYFLGMNTELVASHEGCVICYGSTFEKSIERIMTDEFIDMKSIW